MDLVARIAAVVLGAVFVVAAVSKVLAGTAWVAQARDLGAPMVVATALPAVELVIGGLLIAGIGGALPALTAGVMLVACSVAIARQLVDGRHPPCACFGTWSQKPVGEGHLVRNAALFGLSLLALL